jgi:hypothetical protein
MSSFTSIVARPTVVQIVTAADIARMESPASTWAAQAGLRTGYGLSNYWEVDEGFVYHGHDGGVDGGLTEMHYLADYRTGYFYSINSGSGDALERIGKAIRNYITRDLQKPSQPPVAPLPQDAAEFAGWYEIDSPRQELTHFADNLGGIAYVSVAANCFSHLSGHGRSRSFRWLVCCFVA